MIKKNRLSTAAFSALLLAAVVFLFTNDVAAQFETATVLGSVSTVCGRR